MKPSEIVNESLTQEGLWDTIKSKFSKPPAQPAPAVWKSPRAPVNTPAATSPQAAASNAVPNPTLPNVWKNARNPGVTAANSPQAAAPAKQPTAPPTPNFGAGQNAGYKSVTTNAPTGASPNAQQAAPGATAQPAATQQPIPGQQPTQAPDFSKSLFGPNAGYKSATMNAPTAFNAAAQNATPGATATPAATVQQPTMQPQEPVATEPEKPAKEKPAAEPAATTKKQGTAGKLATGAANAAKSAGGGIWQGVKDLFDPNAKIARAANKAANASRADAIRNQATQFAMATRGIDPSDVDTYRDTFKNWAKTRFTSVDPDTIDEIADTLDPKKPATVTQAIGSVYNTMMTNRATGYKPTPKAPEQTQEPEQEPKQTPAANPFGQMANQLSNYAPPETTSTGGSRTQTPTVQVHRANPNNPNQPQNTTSSAGAPVSTSAGAPVSTSAGAPVSTQTPEPEQVTPAPATDFQQQVAAGNDQFQKQLAAAQPQNKPPLVDKYGRITPAATNDLEAKIKSAWAAQHPNEPMPELKEGPDYSALMWKKMRAGK